MLVSWAAFNRLAALLGVTCITGSLACLCSRRGCFLIRRVFTSLGRSSDSKGDVDIDIGREALGGRVSRLQAHISLTETGSFTITNAGRRHFKVDGVQVSRRRDWGFAT